MSLKDEGFYECIAISSAGTGRARTFLDVSGKMLKKHFLIVQSTETLSQRLKYVSPVIHYQLRLWAAHSVSKMLKHDVLFALDMAYWGLDWCHKLCEMVRNRSHVCIFRGHKGNYDAVVWPPSFFQMRVNGLQ